MGRADESGTFIIFMFHSCHDDIAISCDSCFFFLLFPRHLKFSFFLFLENVNAAHHSIRSYSHEWIHEKKKMPRCPNTCVIFPTNLKMRRNGWAREQIKYSNPNFKENVREKIIEIPPNTHQNGCNAYEQHIHSIKEEKKWLPYCMHKLIVTSVIVDQKLKKGLHVLWYGGEITSAATTTFPGSPTTTKS